VTEALLVIDMQKQFYRGTGKKLMDKSIAVINEATKKFRTMGAPVVWIQHSDNKMGLAEGNPGYEIVDSLVPAEGEVKVVKTKGNGFIGTELDAILKGKGISQLFVCGYAAEGCVNRTYHGALKLNYEVRKVRDATASSSKLLLSIFNRIGRYADLGKILTR